MRASSTRLFRTALVALAPALAIGASLAQVASIPIAAQPGPVGTITGEPERDSIGFLVAVRGGCEGLQPRFAAMPRLIGPVFGDPEKDSFALEVMGHEPCGTGHDAELPRTPYPR